ncbi:unnamed protein product, partial [Brassica oleracea]
MENTKETDAGAYAKLPDYLNKLVTANPGTIVELFTEPHDSAGHKFKYLFNDLSWEWFFLKLSKFVTNHQELVFVSDRHPSISKGISKVFPGTGHFICIVHLKRNIRSNFKGRHLEFLVAKAARTFRLQEFYATFNEIKTMDPRCAEYLL